MRRVQWSLREQLLLHIARCRFRDCFFLNGNCRAVSTSTGNNFSFDVSNISLQSASEKHRSRSHESASALCQKLRSSQDSAAVIGKNGSGKSLFFSQLQQSFAYQDKCGIEKNAPTSKAVNFDEERDVRVQSVSFEDTLSFLKKYGSESVAQVAAGGISSSHARELIVRFGLINCFARRVDSLSTGELRKLMLARAVAAKPPLLLLDGAHDGLDISSRRQFTELLSTLIKGFPPLLVNLGGTPSSDVNSKVQARIMQTSHRAEEIPKELCSVFVFRSETSEIAEVNISKDGKVPRFRTTMEQAKIDRFISEQCRNENQVVSLAWEAQLSLLRKNKNSLTPVNADTNNSFVSRLEKVSILYGADVEGVQRSDETMLPGLRDITWEIERNQSWLLYGGNGAGKSTLSRLFTTPDLLTSHQSLAELANPTTVPHAKLSFSRNEEKNVNLFGTSRASRDFGNVVKRNVGSVSIDSHIRTSLVANRLDASVFDIIGSGLFGAACSGSTSCAILEEFVQAGRSSDINSKLVETACELVGLHKELLSRKFSSVSLGEQRLALVARALIHAPDLLVLDEVGQGLDPHNRKNMVALLEMLHETSYVTIVSITHHLDEIPKNISHFFHLENGQTKVLKAINSFEHDIKRYISALPRN